ncbi:sensor histidine kinase [Leifsonia sp. RAF41]|uniref:sensor histidine kinase n=1 Tax=Leifsonia sp. RAF41 TaxID=3233056 RepID=UPI003F945080
MLPVRRSIARVWSGSAITWWTWLVTLPSALTVMSGLQYVTGGPAAVLAVAALQHAILGGLLLVGAAVLRVVRGRGRPFAVFTIYAVVGAARPLLFLEAGGLLGIRVMAGDLIGRMAINLVVVVVMFSLIAIGVDLVCEHRGMFRRLRAAQHASERDVECAADRLRRLRSTAVDEVVSALEDAATTATAHRLEPVEAARVLRTLAEDVVRPASHRIYDDDSAGGPPEARGLSRGEWAASVIGGMRAAPPITAAVLFTALVLPFALVQIGAVSLLPVVTGLLVLLVAGAGVAAIPLPQRAVPRALLLLVLYSVVGVVLAVTTGLALTLVGENPSSAWFEALTYPLITLGVAFVTSLTIRVRQDQAELERALQSRVGAAARIRSEYDRERASLARLLHAGVQSELIAGALALTSTRAVGPETPGVRLAEVVGRARDALRGGQEEPHAADEVRALVESWSSAIDLRARIEDGVWDRLGDPARTSAVVDAVSEGLANAVRHGDGSPVSVELRPRGDDGVEVVIESGGTLDTARPGIGLRQLSERGTVALREVAGRVELVVDIP